jgi:hypothetical protein
MADLIASIFWVPNSTGGDPEGIVTEESIDVTLALAGGPSQAILKAQCRTRCSRPRLLLAAGLSSSGNLTEQSGNATAEG